VEREKQNTNAFPGYTRVNLVHTNFVFLMNRGILVIAVENGKVVFKQSYTDQPPVLASGAVWVDWRSKASVKSWHMIAHFPSLPKDLKYETVEPGLPKALVKAGAVAILCVLVVAITRVVHPTKRRGEQGGMRDVPLEKRPPET
jgi:hypothetical protein